MFPTLYHFIKDTLGLEFRFLEIVNTFGLFVAFAIGAAYWAMQTEFARKTQLGVFAKHTQQITVGEKFSLSDYIMNGVLLFIFGYKILFLAINTGSDFSPQEHIFTSEGNWLLGILLATAGTYYRYREDVKQRLNPPVKKTMEISIADEMSTITGVALISGFLGAKVFHILETPDNFSLKAVVSQLFTTGGWTFYGGLIMGAMGVLIYTQRRGYHYLNVLDAGVPAMMLSYGVGRFGCHFSGDGDWGIANLKTSSWLPDWAWAYKYPHNVLGKDYGAAGMEPIPGCEGNYCFQLIDPVYPTPLYEALMALALFGVLWFWVRKMSLKPGQVFGIYLIFAGVERFLIESIREHGDSLYRLGDMLFSQAQMISLVLFVTGICVLFLTQKGLLKPASR